MESTDHLAVSYAGLKPGAVSREALKEGLLIFCPWLADQGEADDEADAASAGSWHLDGMDTVDVGSGSLPEVRSATAYHGQAMRVHASVCLASRMTTHLPVPALVQLHMPALHFTSEPTACGHCGH